jgi:thiopurine S-methyltransferase
VEPSVWIEAWKNGRTRFHNENYNQSLLKFFKSFSIKEKSNVFVPLCGKSVDMIWLRDQGHHVYGVELSPIAITDFFVENELSYTIIETEHFKVYKSEGITLFQGDFFKLNNKDMPKVDFVFDRAAIIALPESMRENYLIHMKTLLAENAELMMLTFERTPHTDHGPPHSIPREEMIRNTSKMFTMEVLEEKPEKINSPKMKEAGISEMTRVVYKFKS